MCRCACSRLPLPGHCPPGAGARYDDMGESDAHRHCCATHAWPCAGSWQRGLPAAAVVWPGAAQRVLPAAAAPCAGSWHTRLPAVLFPDSAAGRRWRRCSRPCSRCPSVAVGGGAAMGITSARCQAAARARVPCTSKAVRRVSLLMQLCTLHVLNAGHTSAHDGVSPPCPLRRLRMRTCALHGVEAVASAAAASSAGGAHASALLMALQGMDEDGSALRVAWGGCAWPMQQHARLTWRKPTSWPLEAHSCLRAAHHPSERRSS